MSSQQTDKILDKATYEPLLKKIEAYNGKADSLSDEQYEKYLSDYIELLHLRDQGYPLLLRNGDSLLLNAKPLSTHLLPPIQSRTDRWLLLTFLSEDHELQVQIIKWTINKADEEQSAEITPLADPIPVCIDQSLTLNSRIYSITFTEANEYCFIILTFQQGILNVTANQTEGIISTAWSKKLSSGPVIERSSWGSMDEAVRIKRNTEENWQNDSILDQNNQELGKGSFKHGWIHGADSPEDQANLVYLATNQANVIGIDKNNLNQPIWISASLEGKALDALVVHVPDWDQHAILASTDNGMVYLLIPTAKKPNQFKEKYVQLAGPRIERCIGYGTADVLVLDSRNHLSPLLITNPERFWQQRDQATQHLIKYFFQNSDINVSKLSKKRCRLLLEYYLLGLGDNDNIDEDKLNLFAELCDDLNERIKRTSSQAYSEELHELASLHHYLISRFFMWLKRSSTHEQLKKVTKSETPLSYLWKLITLDQSEPDYVWLPLLRESTWLRRWARKQRVINVDSEFTNNLAEWEASLQTKRQTFAAGLETVRSLNTINHYQLKSHSDHIEILDENDGLIAVLEYSGNLCIHRVNDKQWETLTSIQITSKSSQATVNDQPSPGQRSFIYILPDIHSGKAPSHDKIYLISGSSQGELSLFCFYRQQEKLEMIHQLQCSARLVCCLDIPKQKGVLLGGYNPAGIAVLYGWPYSSILKSQLPKLLWEDQPSDKHPGDSTSSPNHSSSSIRQLRLSKDGKQLWMMNREKGEIYKWDIASGLFEKHRQFPPKPVSILHTVRNLYALDYSSKQNLLVCGGVGGISYAFDTNNQSCYWTVICSGNLRRVVFLPDYPVPSEPQAGAWLLCGDDQSSLIVDYYGKIIGVIELAGPICASAVYPTRKQVVLCTLDGRLILMDYSTRHQQAIADKLADNPLAYPVRVQSPISKPEQINAMLAIQEYDSHSKMAVLQKISAYLKQHELDSQQQKQFLDYWDKLALECQMMFLYWLRNVCLHQNLSDTQRQFVLSMTNAAWNHIKRISESSGLSCKLMSPVLDMLNQLKDTDPLAQQQLTKISNAIWKDQPDKGLLDANSALAAIRWNQSAKRWREITQDIQHVTVETLFHWCNLMVLECNASNTEELRASLVLLNRLQLYNSSNTHQPSQWFLQFVNPAAQPITTDLAFKYLEMLKVIPFTKQQLNELIKLLPNNAIWGDWLHELQNILKLLSNKQQHRPHIAWQEQESWELLREHIAVTGKRRFSVPQAQAMLALWWPQLVKHWERLIEEGCQQLDQAVISKSNDYLDIIDIDRWESSDSIVVDLLLTNRFPEELRLEDFDRQQESQASLKKCLSELPVSLPITESTTPISISLKTKQPDRLDYVLRLKCKLAGSNRTVLVEHAINKNRNLLRLSEEPAWTPTWDRLANLLTDSGNKQLPFYWINGHIWPQSERKHLLADLSAKYHSLEISEKWTPPTDALFKGIEHPIFCPDLALGARPEILLEQVHSILKPIAQNQAHYWAMAIWREGKGLPESVCQALNSKLPTQQAVLALLNHLLGKKIRKSLLQALKQLPQSALGAWCAEEPFYTAKDASVDASEIYPSSSALLPLAFWEAVDQEEVTSCELAELLAISPQQATADRQARQLFYQASEQLFNSHQQSAEICEPVIKHLFARLDASGINAESAMWWSLLTITLNWRDYSICYVLPKCNATVRAQMRDLAVKKHPSELPLWLCLGESSPPDDLPGLAIGINSEDTLTLMHVNNQYEAAGLLNQIVALEHGINANGTFRSAGGLGSLVYRQFGGREKELGKLWACLDEVDKQGAGALIIGRRRIGKTTLRERIRFEINRQQPKRVCLEFNFEGRGEDPLRVGIELEFWFFKRMQEAFEQAGYPFDDKWPKSLKSNVDKRDEARNLLNKHLDTIKNRTDFVPLFIFDETENLVRWDTASSKECWSLFALLRHLTQQGKLCWFATSYPHGLDSPYSLNVANLSSNTPVYNTFAAQIQLDAWQPITSWDYLSSRLAGLGVVLPRHYRDEILTISQGIPWIIHAIGLHLCEALPKGEKVVSPHTWHIVKTKVLKEIHDNLKVSVTKVANDLDLKAGLLESEHQLGNGQLWRAFHTLAEQSTITLSPTANHWSAPIPFTREQLETQLPDVDISILREALRRLSSSPVIEGIASEEKLFVFANNLLPAWIQQTEE